jgi:hypothetical protein
VSIASYATAAAHWWIQHLDPRATHPVEFERTLQRALESELRRTDDPVNLTLRPELYPDLVPSTAENVLLRVAFEFGLPVRYFPSAHLIVYPDREPLLRRHPQGQWIALLDEESEVPAPLLTAAQLLSLLTLGPGLRAEVVEGKLHLSLTTSPPVDTDFDPVITFDQTPLLAQVGVPVQLTVQVTDADQDELGVEFFLGSASLGMGSTTDGTLFTLSWTPTATGTFFLRVEAFDGSGEPVSSPTRQVTVSQVTTYSASYTTTTADFTSVCGSDAPTSGTSPVTRTATSTVSQNAADTAARDLALAAITCPTRYQATQQSYTTTTQDHQQLCPDGGTIVAVTRSSSAGSSYVSQEAADLMAQLAARDLARAAVVCPAPITFNTTLSQSVPNVDTVTFTTGPGTLLRLNTPLVNDALATAVQMLPFVDGEQIGQVDYNSNNSGLEVLFEYDGQLYYTTLQIGQVNLVVA